MAQNEEILRKTLAAFETVRGTPVAVTRKLYEIIRLMDAREPLDFDENAGSYDAWRTFVLGPVDVAGTAEGPVAYEDFGWWMQAGVGGAGPVFAPATATDNLKSITMQHGVPDNVYTSAMVMVPEWTVRGDVDGDSTWMFDATLLARSLEHVGGGFTAGVLDRTREFVRAPGTQLFIDDDAADIGTTEVVGKFISFSVTWNNAVIPKRFMEDIDAISARIGRGPRQITGQVRLEFDTDDERAKYRAGTSRAIRIVRDGTGTKTAQIDIPRAQWITPSDDPRDTNMTLTYAFRAYMDDVAGYPAQITTSAT